MGTIWSLFATLSRFRQRTRATDQPTLAQNSRHFISASAVLSV